MSPIPLDDWDQVPLGTDELANLDETNLSNAPVTSAEKLMLFPRLLATVRKMRGELTRSAAAPARTLSDEEHRVLREVLEGSGFVWRAHSCDWVRRSDNGGWLRWDGRTDKLQIIAPVQIPTMWNHITIEKDPTK